MCMYKIFIGLFTDAIVRNKNTDLICLFCLFVFFLLYYLRNKKYVDV